MIDKNDYTGIQIHMGRSQYCVYIVANKDRTIFESGITGDLKGKLAVLYHEYMKTGQDIDVKSKRCFALLHCEYFNEALEAIKRERALKSWSVAKKKELICKNNPGLDELNDQISNNNYSFIIKVG